MRKIIAGAAVIIGMFVQAAAQEPEDVDFTMNARSEFHGRIYIYQITNNDLKGTPAWEPQKGDPPLSISKAVKIARDNVTIFVFDPKGWEPVSIRLTSTSKKRWYYFVTFNCTIPECVEGSGRGFNILVKLDGTVVRPIIQGSSEKSEKPL